MNLKDASLNEIPGLAWSMLADGAARGRAPFHTPVLASAGPDARTVVLRVADRATRTVVCHTDQRSPKVAALAKHDAVVWVFYDPDAKVQVRLRGQVTLHHGDEIAAARWDASRPGSRRCYQNPLAPGADVDMPESALPDPERDGYLNFTVVRCTVDVMDWLYLHALGHRRARFTWHDGDWRGTWIAP